MPLRTINNKREAFCVGRKNCSAKNYMVYITPQEGAQGLFKLSGTDQSVPYNGASAGNANPGVLPTYVGQMHAFAD